MFHCIRYSDRPERYLLCTAAVYLVMHTDGDPALRMHSLPSNRQYLSCDACLDVKREVNENCSGILCTTVVYSDKHT